MNFIRIPFISVAKTNDLYISSIMCYVASHNLVVLYECGSGHMQINLSDHFMLFLLIILFNHRNKQLVCFASDPNAIFKFRRVDCVYVCVCVCVCLCGASIFHRYQRSW